MQRENNLKILVISQQQTQMILLTRKNIHKVRKKKIITLNIDALFIFKERNLICIRKDKLFSSIT